MTIGHQRQASARRVTARTRELFPLAFLVLVVGCIPVAQFKRDGGIRLVSHEQPIAPQVRDAVASAPPLFEAESKVRIAAKTAVDMVVELESKLEAVQRKNRHLRKSLQIAEDTIEDQRESMAQAAAELNKSRLDFERMQAEMKEWRGKFTRLNQQAIAERKAFDQAFQRMEQRLQTMLIQYADELPSPSVEKGTL